MFNDQEEKVVTPEDVGNFVKKLQEAGSSDITEILELDYAECEARIAATLADQNMSADTKPNKFNPSMYGGCELNHDLGRSSTLTTVGTQDKV
jgi:hypothetical protein